MHLQRKAVMIKRNFTSSYHVMKTTIYWFVMTLYRQSCTRFFCELDGSKLQLRFHAQCDLRLRRLITTFSIKLVTATQNLLVSCYHVKSSRRAFQIFCFSLFQGLGSFSKLEYIICFLFSTFAQCFHPLYAAFLQVLSSRDIPDFKGEPSLPNGGNEIKLYTCLYCKHPFSV